MKEGARPVVETQRPIPIHIIEPLREKLEVFLKESEHARGWVHNVVLTKKKWSEKTIRLNIDTRAMEMYVDVTNFPICRVPRQAEQGVARLAWRGADKG